MKGGNQGRISERRVTNKKENASELYYDGQKKEEKEEEEDLTSRLQAAGLRAANEILKEDISLIKAHKGHP